MTKDQNLWKASLLAAGSSLFALGFALPAVAQDTAAETVATPDDAERVESTVVVTGSRIARTELATPAPIVSLGSEDLLASGEVDVANFLRETPALLLSDNANQSLVNGGAQGASLLNLRGLGTNRTLVLQNGRRHVAGISGSAAVDVSTIPAALIDRVEILTGGASSIYGADAVTGVVNFILKDDFDGLESRGQFSISDSGDGEEYFLSITAGKNFYQDRGNVYVSADYTHTSPITGFDRPGLAGSTRLQFVDATPDLIAATGAPDGTEVVLANDIRFPFSSAAGAIDVFGVGGAIDTQFFDSSNGTLRPFDFGQSTGNFFESIGGDGIILSTDRDFIIPEIDRYNVNAGASFEFNQYFTLFAEGKFSRSDSVNLAGVNGFNDFIEVRADNPFIPAALQTMIDGTGSAASADIRITRDVLDDTTVPFVNAERETYRGVIGFKGELNNGWNYEASFNYGRTDSTITSLNDRIDDRLFAATDAFALNGADLTAFNAAGGAGQALRGGEIVNLSGNAQAGDIVCRSEFEADTGAALSDPPRGTFPGGTVDGFVSFTPGDGTCVPTSLFGENAINAGAAAFAFIPTFTETEIEQIVAGFTIAGDSSSYFELPAGPVSFATGFEYRDESSNFQPSAFDTPLGATFSASAGQAQVSTVGEFDVTEVFGEISVPIINGFAPFNDVTVDGSIRYADYSTSGSNFTWGVGANWEVVPDLRFRGSYSEAVRAPNIFELFSPLSPAALGAEQDPCNPAFINQGPEGGIRAANCEALVGPNFLSANTAFVSGTTGGNVLLEPEEAVTYTAGIVLQPRIIEGLTITVDYWDIEIEDAIASLAGFTIAENCVDADSINNAFCEAIDRDPTTGSITFFRSGQQNIGALEVNGVDVSASYNVDLEDLFNSPFGSIDLSVNATRLIKDRIFADQNDLTTQDPEEFEVGRPKWNATASANWTLNNLSLGWQTRYQSSQFFIDQTDVAAVRQSSFPVRTGDSFVHDLNVSYALEMFGKEQRLYGGVNNVADRDPFVTLQTQPVSALGRTFFVGYEVAF